MDSTCHNGKNYISNNQELYAAVEVSIGSLEQEGRAAEAAKLREALSISTIAGEVLGMTRSVLRTIEQDRNVSFDLRSQIREEITYIDAILGKANHTIQ